MSERCPNVRKGVTRVGRKYMKEKTKNACWIRRMNALVASGYVQGEGMSKPDVESKGG